MLQVGAQAVVEEHTQRVDLQGKVEVLENTQEKRLNIEVANKIKSLNKKDNLVCLASLGIVGVVGAGNLTMIIAAGIVAPFSLVGTIPMGMQLTTAALLFPLDEIFSTEKERYILENYPKALYDENVKALASQEYDKIQKAKQQKKPMMTLLLADNCFF